MLKWLVRWLQKFWQFTFCKTQTASTKSVATDQMAKQPPQLTNADLEYLFTQLLEGVSQARGQQWAIKYLQRMEHRISVERWIEWLLNFGERLLISSAPNYQIAERMVQLGELRIGTIGDLAYDLGTRLLMRNLSEEYWESYPENLKTTAPIPIPIPPPSTELIHDFYLQESNLQNQEQDVEITTSLTTSSLPKTPGIDLIRNLGELLWEYEEDDVVSTTHVGFVPPLEDVKENTPSTTPVNIIDAWKEEEPIWVQETLSAVSAAKLWDESWTNLPPVVETTQEQSTPEETTLDDVWMGLEQNANLVHQSTVELEIEKTARRTIIDVLKNQSQTTTTTQAQAYFYQGLQEAKIGNLSGALKSYNKAVELKPDAYEYWFNRGLTLFYLRNLAEAIASYDRVIEIKPDFYKGWYNRGAALSELGRFNEALASFEQALEYKGDYSEAWSGRGLMQLKLRQVWQAISSFDQALLLQPHEPEICYFRAIALAETGQIHDAIACYDKAIEFNPEFDLAWYNRGMALFNLGRVEQAITNYRQAIKINPGNHEAWYALGGALEKLASWEDAIAAYDQATRIKPDFHDVWLDRGVVLANLGNWQDAIACWDQAIAINSDFYLTWFNRGVALDNLGRREEAIVSYNKAIEIQPYFHLAWYNRGVAQFHLNRFEEAIASYDGALQIQLDYWEAWLARGNAAANAVNCEGKLELSNNTITATNPALNERGDYGKLASFQQGLKYVSPDSQPEGWGRLNIAIGNVYYDLGKRNSTPRSDWLQAATAYEQALVTLTAEIFPLLHLEVLQNLIKTLVVLGETAPAQQYQQRAIYLLQNLLNEANRSDESKKQLALKFAGLGQLTVDIAIQCGEIAQAWEIAEQGKNACINWLLYGWTNEIYSPSYTEVNQLLNPTTAIIYWHISPCTLRTFVIKYDSPEPIPIFTPVLNFASISELPVPEAVASLIKFEDWVKEWNQQYQEYHSLAEDEQTKSKHSWRLDMERRLLQLKNILNICAIIQELEDITHLILIPHRDLHSLPLHTLFHIAAVERQELPNLVSNFTMNYLPSAQIGLSLNSDPSIHIDQQLLLSVEQPNSTGYSRQKFAKIEAEVISQTFTHCQRIPELQAYKTNIEKALLKKYNIFHFVGQLSENFVHPYQSELVIADGEKLSLAEISKAPLANYKLFTLSTSKTGIDFQNSITTEHVSLVNGLLSLGVPYIVNNLWTVESAASALVMIEFYRGVKQNKAISTALADAVAWLKELTAEHLTKWYENLLNQLPADEFRIKALLAAEIYKISQLPANQKIYDHYYHWGGFKVMGRF